MTPRPPSSTLFPYTTLFRSVCGVNEGFLDTGNHDQMNVMALLARNFVRQNRWLLLAFVLWPFLLGAFEWSPHHAADPETVAVLLKQEIFYGVVVAQSLSSSAIYSEKQSGRIVGVLSRAGRRTGY